MVELRSCPLTFTCATRYNSEENKTLKNEYVEYLCACHALLHNRIQLQ